MPRCSRPVRYLGSGGKKMKRVNCQSIHDVFGDSAPGCCLSCHDDADMGYCDFSDQEIPEECQPAFDGQERAFLCCSILAFVGEWELKDWIRLGVELIAQEKRIELEPTQKEKQP